MKYDVAYANRLGNRQTNEDRFTVVETPHAVFLVLADGMGGHKGGKIASQTFVDCCAQMFNNASKPIAEPHQFLEDIIHIAHHDVIRAGKAHHPPIEPRSTGVVCLVQDGYAWWAHVGDSRLYHLRFSRVISHTRDHSEVEELFQQGIITEQEKQTHPYRNMVTQCIGSPRFAPKPTFADKVPLQRGDVLLLCSDGLWSAFTDEEMGRILRNTELYTATEILASEAESNTFPNSDNISIVTLRWQSSTAIEAATLDPGGNEYDELSQSLEAIKKAVQDLEGKA